MKVRGRSQEGHASTPRTVKARSRAIARGLSFPTGLGAAEGLREGFEFGFGFGLGLGLGTAQGLRDGVGVSLHERSGGVWGGKAVGPAGRVASRSLGWLELDTALEVVRVACSAADSTGHRQALRMQPGVSGSRPASQEEVGLNPAG